MTWTVTAVMHDTSDLSGQAPDGLRRIDKIVEQVALVMLPTGFVFIILGWVGASSMPSSSSSFHALRILLISEPPAMGDTTWSGVRQPSCSAISKA